MKCFFKGFSICLLISLLSKDVFAKTPLEFQQALPGYKYNFPRDFYSHDDFKMEWWYYTGNLKTENKHHFGYQLTFFRVALDRSNKIPNLSRWKIGQIYFAHLTTTDIDEDRFYFFERVNRKAINTAGAKSDRFLIWNEDWILTKSGNAHRLKAIESGTGIDLSLVPVKKLVFHGENGISQKGAGEGNASHYFSYTRMISKGKVWIRGKAYEVEGTSWMDREFSSNQLTQEQVGWDWFSLKLNNQAEVMLYQIRLKGGDIEPYSSATLIEADGSSRKLELNEFKINPTNHWTSQNTGVKYPSKWNISLIDEDVQLEVLPDVAEQELHHLRSIAGSYWEGSVSIRGKFRGRPVSGKGYVELVGYEKPLDSIPMESEKTN